jgi:hypothetical protein
MINEKSDVVAKANNIHEDGRKAAILGTETLFTGFPESLVRRVHVSLKFDLVTDETIKQRIIQPLNEMARSIGYEFFKAGSDFPIHTTVLEGEWKGRDPDAVPTLTECNLLSLDPSLRDTQSLAKEKTVRFSRLVLNSKGETLLLSQEIPAWTVDMRTRLADTYMWLNFKPLPLDNLLHATLLRLMKVGAGNSVSAMTTYLHEVERINLDLEGMNIVAKVEKVWIGSTANRLIL